MNPIQMLQAFLGKGGNPQELVMKAIGMTGNNNPMISNLINMAKSGDGKSVETFARNLFSQKGRDFDKEFKTFLSQMNIK